MLLQIPFRKRRLFPIAVLAAEVLLFRFRFRLGNRIENRAGHNFRCVFSAQNSDIRPCHTAVEVYYFSNGFACFVSNADVERRKLPCVTLRDEKTLSAFGNNLSCDFQKNKPRGTFNVIRLSARLRCESNRRIYMHIFMMLWFYKSVSQNGKIELAVEDILSREGKNGFCLRFRHPCPAGRNIAHIFGDDISRRVDVGLNHK